jgi:hypothetical protein
MADSKKADAKEAEISVLELLEEDDEFEVNLND